MPKARRNTGRPKPRVASRSELAESRAAEVLTIAWTVSVTGVLIADLMLVAAHLYARFQPQAQRAALLVALLLVMAAAMGVVSLALLPLVWRVRRLKPPRGYVVFSVLVSAAPIAALIARLVQ